MKTFDKATLKASPAFSAKVERLHDIQIELKRIKSEELKLRKEVSEVFLEGESVGTHNFQTSGFNVKAVRKVNYSLDKEMLAEIWDSLSAEEQNAIRYNPALDMKAYKTLGDSDLLDECVVVKPATPTITIEFGQGGLS